MNKTNAYQEITSGICPLANDLHLVTLLLDHLHQRNEIIYEQYKQMYPNLETLELAHIYFNLKVHKPEISVRPIVASINAPARLISSFLDQLLTPIYNYVTKDITFINSIDLIRQLKKYQEKGYLTSTTLFVTFDVTDLYTMIPHDGAIAALRRFCQKYSINGKIGNLKIDTIIKLASVVLDTNTFAYKNKYYRQIKGGAMGSPFTMVLANIYIYETSRTDPNIKITITIKPALEYLNATIENNHGQLKTTIYHKTAWEPHILPYESDHPRHIHANIIYTMLVRATRICSTIEDFDIERLSAEMILLVNDYPPKFIQHHMKNFFVEQDGMKVWTELNSEAYQQLHNTLLYKPTRRETKKDEVSVFFLDQLRTPIYNYVTKDITFINSIGLIRKLNEYQQKGYLTSTTLFVIFDVTDLYTMIPRDGAIAALRQFCQKYSVNGKIKNLKVETIIKLASIVLDTISFAYKNKYYRQIKGGAMGSPFTMVLANIHMLEWEQKLMQHQNRHHEIYGRYIDVVFITTNLSKEDILKLLDETVRTDPNIKMTITINQALEYLDAIVENNNGQLRTTIYHKSAWEPHILPYKSDHPRHINANIIYTMLVRAARLCSTVEDFDMERLSTEMILLVNGYPPKFIQQHIKNFFIQHDAMKVWTELNTEAYEQLYNTLLYKPTRKENQIYVHYTFENGPLLNFKKEYRQIWEKFYVYPGSRLKNTRLILGTILNGTLQSLLIHKTPKRDMLTIMQPSTETPRRTINEKHPHE
ncbi:unnamed protein product [Rotaria sordida]|uniref:Helix-turn-helix domain-containing protein n=2 Tax=Rotaria sordida TaxID=392033 RepID=A0A815KK57_9BILA|nr:unnamed protein product [Rotaria sordida]